MPEAKLHDGSTIEIQIHGSGPNLLLPVNPTPVEGEQAEQMRQYGVDPALGQSFIQGLRDLFRLVVFDYEGHVLRNPKPETLTPDNIARDLLAIADAARAETFAYYGYSWLAVSGLQLAIRTGRLTALVMGGYPPIHGPYQEMLKVTQATYQLAGKPVQDDPWSAESMTREQAQQFVTLYEALQGFDDRAAQSKITCPRLCFVGSADEIQYEERWGGVLVSLAGPILRERAQLEALGWEVRVLDGLDHIQAMQAAQAVPILRAWLPAQVAKPTV